MKYISGQLFYKKIPIARVLISLIVGILIEYHFKVSVINFLVLATTALVLLMAFNFLSTAKKFIYNWVAGLAAIILFVGIGGIISYYKNIEHYKNWIGNYYTKNSVVKVTLQENVSIKQKSYKALAKASAVLVNNEWKKVDGDVLLYFKKDSTLPKLQYGSQIIITDNLLPIINAGNPGGFNYAEYCKFQNISYQAFLKDDDFVDTKQIETNLFNSTLIETREIVLTILRKYIKSPEEISVAEALLIGYRDDLDRDLVQKYSNTGVVHIIAISGLHLGMIYWLLLKIFIPIEKRKRLPIIKPIFILFVLWAFTFIAGAAPSILRSAVMFSFIVVGETIDKRSNILNNLAVSAFLLLIINPFSLWDVGFQLSYSAVLSIVLFHRHINRWLYFKNKLLQYFWSLNALSLSAQILTLPIVLYHFHQFPTLFLFTNIFAVPFSGLILILELLLLLVSSITSIANIVGITTEYMIFIMNLFVKRTDSLPFAVWPSIQINIIQAIFLYAAIVGISFWLIQKKQKGFVIGIAFLATFIFLRSKDFIEKNQQQKLIVYNVPNHTAIDIVQGRKYKFLGDAILEEDGFLRNFHIKPSRVLHRMNSTDTLFNCMYNDNLIVCNGKNIFILDDNFYLSNLSLKIKVDVVIITRNPKIDLSSLSTIFQCKQYVFDSSNPFYQVDKWKKEADSLNLLHHSTATQGAFEMNL